ncbi:hypothetical protein [Priestia endophytica]|uniref:hypothetical protein n=1 Tax=Priestia endophytica TaxID=135735 RepID=UPI00228301E8|nr:hypothetical protein [Priestia endophytica]MCY8233699.1 hypothetical protein [Priestia endophytica]
MDRLDEISLSKIATVLNKQTIVHTDSNSMWERILSNSGQSQLYYEFSRFLNPYSYNNNWKNYNRHFEEFFSAINSILKIIYSKGKNIEEFSLFIGSIIEEVRVENIFEDNIGDVIYEKCRHYDLSGFFGESSDDECIKLIKEESREDFQTLLKSLHVLNFDITYSKGGLKLIPFTEQSNQVSRNPSLLDEWLNKNYPSIAEMYQEAINNYSSGESVSCISNCRNIITGLFSHFKDNGSKSWIRGLQKLSTDTNIENVKVANNIMQGSANKNIPFETDNEFNYPRFKLFYQLYSLTSDLGSHSTEAPKIDGVLCPENTTMNDALLCLRMTEDILIWVIERLKQYEQN